MIVGKLLGGIRRLAIGPRRQSRRLISVEQMQWALERERARTDRNGDGFSLLVFTLRNHEEDLREHLRLARILARRIRITDEAGWIAEDKIGVILPSTRVSGAWKLADDLCLTYTDDPPPVCEVFCYPTDSLEGSEINNALPTHRQARPLEMLFCHATPLWKRALDVTGAAVGLVILLPLMAIVALGIKLTAPGPVFFSQLRTGRGGRQFRMYKFRTMIVDAERLKAKLRALSEQDGPAFKLTKDPRVTWFGRWLRKTSIDELPQLWNVLRGEMSLVGPRPLPCDEAAACLGWHRRRLDVVPGLTCLWQVSARSRVTFNEWIRLDIRYIAAYSPLYDLLILAWTVPAVVRAKGAR